jgi:hypothetical protein
MTSQEEYLAAHKEWGAACGKVDKHLETCVECDDFRARGVPPCRVADKLLEAVSEACDRRNQAIKDRQSKREDKQ